MVNVTVLGEGHARQRIGTLPEDEIGPPVAGVGQAHGHEVSGAIGFGRLAPRAADRLEDKGLDDLRDRVPDAAAHELELVDVAEVLDDRGRWALLGE